METAARRVTSALPWALAISLAAGLVPPVELNPASVTLVGLVTAGLLGVAAAVTAPRALGRATATALATAAVLAVAIAARSTFADNPAVSLWGVVGQHNGAALWVLAALWLAAGAMLADARALRGVVGVVAAAGAVFSVMTLVEVASGGVRGWGSAAGAFENSTSAGEFGAVAVVAAVAWALYARSSHARVAAIACAALSGAGIVAAGSRVGVAAVAGAAVFALVAWLARTQRAEAALAIGTPVAAALATGALVAGSTGALGDGAVQAISRLGTARDAIWRSAAAQVPHSPLVGRGAEQFSAWAAWAFDGRALAYNGTYDPHNLVLSVLLAGGAVALVLAAGALAALVWALLSATRGAPRSLAQATLAAMPACVVTAGLFAWGAPAAVLAAAAIAGALLGASSRTGDASGPSRAGIRIAIAATLVPAVAIVVLGARALPVERSFHLTHASASPEALVAMYGRFPDPAYAVAALDRMTAVQGGLYDKTIKALLAASAKDSRWDVNRALLGLSADPTILPTSTDEYRRLITRARDGMAADPASGLWYTVVAAEADRRGLGDDARRYATLALRDRGESAQTRAVLKVIANRAGAPTSR